MNIEMVLVCESHSHHGQLVLRDGQLFRRQETDKNVLRFSIVVSIVVALGFSERHNNSLYIAQCTIDKTGEIVMKRRKMMPTHMERTVFGNSSGESLNNVVDTGVGKVGQLACWEHIQPLLKYHTITQHEKIHIAAWPPVFPYAGPQELWSMTKEGECSMAVHPRCS